MNPQQIAATVVGALLIAAVLGIVKWVTAKADQQDLDSLGSRLESKADKVELNRVESESKAANQKLEVKLDAALLIVAAAVSRPELTEKILAMTGRADDRIQRIVADIVQLTTDAKSTAKSTAELDKRLDDLPGRVRALEETQKHG